MGNDYQFPPVDPKELTEGPAPRGGERFMQLYHLMAYLRSPQGCPWDREQTIFSLRRYVKEESEELIGVIDQLEREESEENYQRLIDELGDLMLQILFISQILEEQGRGDVFEVMEALRRKLVRRHPHVFGKAKADTPEEVRKTWEELKQLEREGKLD